MIISGGSQIMSRGYGKNQRKIIGAFENSHRDKAEVDTLIFYIKGEIDSLHDTMQIMKLNEKRDEIIKTSFYKSVLNSLSRLEKDGVIEKSYKNLGTDNAPNNRILTIEYCK